MYLSLQSGEVQENAAVSSPSTAVVKADILGVPGLPSNSWALVMFPHQLPGYPGTTGILSQQQSTSIRTTDMRELHKVRA